MFFRTSTQSLEKRQINMPLFEFPEHAPEKFLACFMRMRARWHHNMMNHEGLWQGITG